MIIGFGFKARVGKDTSGDYLKNTYYWKTEAFARSLKEGIGKGIFGLTDIQMDTDKEKPDPFWEMTPRQILQKAGTEYGRSVFGDDLWVKTVKRRIDLASTFNYAITDVRYKNEAETIKKWGGIVVRIDRDIVGTKSDHISETELDGWDGFNEVVDNNGDFNHLYAQLDKIVSKYVLAPPVEAIAPTEAVKEVAKQQ